MPVVDSHCHASGRWYEPVDTLLFNMDRHGVDRAILVQLLGSTDSADMIAACRAHPGRFHFIAAIDPAHPDVPGEIERAAQAGAAGLRMRAGWRSTEGDPLAFWRAVEQAGLRVSMVGPAASFADGKLEEIAAACPRLEIMLEHMGGLARPDVGDREAALPLICDLARLPNLSVKLTGLGQLAPRRADMDADSDRTAIPLDMTGILPLFDAIFRAFSPARTLWGSDFPPVAAREGYNNALNWSRDFIVEHWPEAVAPCFGGTAQRLFGG